MDLEAQQVQEAHHCHLVLLITLIASQVTYYYNMIFLTPTAPIPYHISILTGEGWMLELLNGHPNRIRTCLGVTHDIFNKLVQELRHCDGITESSQLSIEEQLGIFLYTCVTGCHNHDRTHPYSPYPNLSMSFPSHQNHPPSTQYQS